MRNCTALILGLAVVASLSLSAKPTFPKEAKEKGVEGVTNCMSCHTSIAPGKVAFGPKGKYLVDRKKKENAKDVDVAWLKDFKA
jgi:cytochrome c2